MLLGPLALAESSVEVVTLHSRVENVAQSGVSAIYCDEEHTEFYAKQATAGKCTIVGYDVDLSTPPKESGKDICFQLGEEAVR